jgi:hypothetical protein
MDGNMKDKTTKQENIKLTETAPTQEILQYERNVQYETLGTTATDVQNYDTLHS